MTQPDLSGVVRARIHPSIGIARIGDSAEEYLIGPEVPEPPVLDPAEYKDGSGALKRQAARFRVYGYDAADNVVAELTADTAELSWQVHLVNSKAAWYQFQIALDIPEAADPDAAEPSLLRNATVADRDSLIIDPGPRSVSGANAPAQAFDTGRFLDTTVYLGELRTDEAGRLIVLGGRGVSASATGAAPTTFANNDGWHDDTADGPVTATVAIAGRDIPVEPSWVVVAPPNYAPLVKSVRTMYDLMLDVHTADGTLPVPEQVSFSKDILPILTRMCDLQWVNQGFATGYGWAGRQHFLDPGYLARLASPAEENAELRLQVWSSCRDWDRDGESPVPWPWIYGDAMNLPPVSPRQYLMFSPLQYSLLQRWAAGNFVDDYDPDYQPASQLSDVPLADQPATLDRAALEFCLADAFHPGCEMTWPMRHTTMYSAPFRIRHREPGSWAPTLGSRLTPAAVGAVGGPLYAQSPGDITRWMAVPWQTDTASCRSGYTLSFGPAFDPYMPTFWPARVPNQVLTQADYEIVMDESRSLAERQAAFERRASWLRFLTGPYVQQLETMISDFGKLGVVTTQPGPTDSAGFPEQIMVESEVGFDQQGVPPLRNLITLHAPDGAPPADQPALRTLQLRSQDVTVGEIDLVRRFRRRPR